MPLPRVQTNIIRKIQDLGGLTEEQVEELVNTEGDLSGNAVEKLLVEEYKVGFTQILIAKAAAFDMSPISVKTFEVGEQTFDRLERDFCKEHKILPLGVVGEFAVIAIADPFNSGLAAEVSRITKRKVHTLLAMEDEIMAFLQDKKEEVKQESVEFGDVIETLEMDVDEDKEDFDEDELEEESAPIVQLASRIIEDAYYSGGSDIHIDPFEKHCRVRVRIDGVLQEKLNLPSKVAGALLARLKVMSNLDIAEKRLPQDGRIVFKQFTRKNMNIDLRVSTAPLNHGEGVVMRILDKSKSTLPLTALGFSDTNLSKYRECIKLPYGMVLHCGPTGSGKSMTLYSALNEINDPAICIRTAEDPIEYTLDGLCQMQMQRKIGLTFANALRAFLRQDPDIILVGEIRDQETANIAVEAALTGHMLFSTLHTNDAPSTIARLTEMEVESFMISASLVCVCAQRLMRRVCKTCRQLYEPEGREKEILEKAIKWCGPIYRANPAGCPACGQKGYKGRVGTHEMMTSDGELVKGINAGLEAAKLKRAAVRAGMITLHQDTLDKVKNHLTTLEHAVATVPPDMEDLDKIIGAESLELALAL